MQIRIFKDASLVAQAAAMLVTAEVLKKPTAILGLATGSSPIPTYQALIDFNKRGIVDFSSVRSFNLDEYVGISETHPCSYHQFMVDELFSHINIKMENTRVPNGNAADLVQEGLEYDKAIEEAGGIDLQILGIGRNGHIGFNEPDDFFTYACHPVALTKSTIEANRRFFETEEAVPKAAISMGVGSILNAKTILLIATGADKAEAVRDAIYGDITPKLPASILRTHKDVYFLLDTEAAKYI